MTVRFRSDLYTQKEAGFLRPPFFGGAVNFVPLHRLVGDSPFLVGHRFDYTFPSLLVNPFLDWLSGSNFELAEILSPILSSLDSITKHDGSLRKFPTPFAACCEPVLF